MASVNRLRNADCLADAHPFLKHAMKEIQVQTFLPLPGALDAKGQAVCVHWRESGEGCGRCVCLLSSAAFSGISEGI